MLTTNYLPYLLPSWSYRPELIKMQQATIKAWQGCPYHSKEMEIMFPNAIQEQLHPDGTRCLLLLPRQLVRPDVDDRTKRLAQMKLLKDKIFEDDTAALDADDIRRIQESASPNMYAQARARVHPKLFPPLDGMTILKFKPHNSEPGGLAIRTVLVPKLLACTQTQHSRPYPKFPIRFNTAKALCPFLPEYLPPLDKQDIALVYIDVPSPLFFDNSIKSVIAGLNNFDLLFWISFGLLQWKPAFNDPDELGRAINSSMANSQSGMPGIQRDTNLNAADIIRLIDATIRYSFNYCKLGVWDTALWDRLDAIYAGLLRALNQNKVTYILGEMCSWDRLDELIKTAPTTADLYRNAMGFH